MQRMIQKAGVLIEALPYIQGFRNTVIVVKFGGSAMEEKAHAEGILEDLTFMECVGMLPVVVHGGGKAISREMKTRGIQARFVKGHRVTCEKTIEVVEQVVNHAINPAIVADLARFGARARGIRGQDVFRAVKKCEKDRVSGEEMDWGYVGEPSSVNVDAIVDALNQNVIPVVSPLGLGEDGMVYNMNADTAAAAVAIALKARKLAFLSDVPGLLRDAADPDSLLTTLRVEEVEELMAKGVIDGGMLPKVKGGVDALHAGVRKVHMIDGRMPHSLLLELFTDKGVGTEIIKE